MKGAHVPVFPFLVALVAAPACGWCADTGSGGRIAGDDWLAYNKTLDGQRYSPLTQINAKNAATLKEVCRVEVAHRGSFQSGPLIVEGAMYVTAEQETVALDPVTCAIRWRQVYHPQRRGVVLMNRGVAFANGRLFRGTEDASVLALDAASGQQLWVSVVGDVRLGEYIPSAPLVWNGLVFVGTAVGELGIKGRILALDAQTGREIWRFSTIPTGTEQGADTWKNTTWAEHGGGGTWSSFALDPVTGELFVPVGNPVPDFSPQDRPGSNLFTDSVLVLDARTGALHWWYQLVPHDGMDWDLGAAPMLYRDGKERDLVAAAGKDGYLHVVDRSTHALAFKVATTTVDAPQSRPASPGAKMCPGPLGGTEWNGPAFDPVRKMIFTGALDLCATVQSAPGETYVTGRAFIGGTWQIPMEPATGWVSAFDANTGKVRWKFHTEAPVVSGITPTAGGIVMAGDNAGNFIVLDSDTGKQLKKVETKGSLSGGIVTYEIGGRQYVAFNSGNISRSQFGAVGRPSIIVMRAELTEDSKPSPVEHGRDVYMQSCLGCHGADGTGIKGFDLHRANLHMTAEQLMSWIRNPSPPMPKVFSEPLDDADEEDLKDLAAFLAQW